MPIRGVIPEGANLACQCQGAACNEVVLERFSLFLQREIQAVVQTAFDVVAAENNGSLVVRRSRGGMVWEIADDAPETDALVRLRDLMNAGVDVYGRPLIDNDRSTFTDRDGVRTYSRASVRALLVKPILNPADRRGWTPAREATEERMKGEKRFIEFRAEGDTVAGPLLVYGDRAKFGEWSESFKAGALKIGPDLIANLQHDRTRPVARTGAGLEVRDAGASVEARITFPDTVYAREARELVAARIIRGFSMEFRAIRDEWQGRNRIVHEAELLGLALVDRPAYPESQIAMRFEELHDMAPMPRRRVFV